MAHALSTNFLARDFYTAPLANNPFKTNTLVLSTGAFPIFGRTEDFFTEQAIFLRL